MRCVLTSEPLRAGVVLLALFPGVFVLPADDDVADDAVDDVIPHRQDRVPNRPYSPEEALALMEVPEGFTVELVANEPEIVNPIAMTFDDRGRIFVTESIEYPRKAAEPGRDRVKVLEDTDRDGRADRVTVFADGLNIPTGVAVGHGGVWVLNAPDLLFFEEEDGKAARREVVVTGFGRTDTHELPSSLTWGPDGWLYGLNGVFNHSRVPSRGKEHVFTCALWRVHPRTREFEVFCEGTSNPWGLVWDQEGSALVSACHWANDHIFHFVETGYYQRQAGPYPPHTMVLGSASDHSHQKTAYCGLAWFDSDAYPEEYRGRLYMGNVHGNCINVDVLERDGSTYRSTAAPDFLTANDVWFMPVSQKVGPDGSLYILDWYDRYHCYQDANRDPEGIDRLKGRLYRVRYGETPRAPRFDLGAESDERLIERLGSANVFFREAAQRVLAERGTSLSRRRLEEVARGGDSPRKKRLHALWARISSGPLGEDFHLALLGDEDAAVRAWGVRAAGNMGEVAPAVAREVARVARDPSPDVRLQAAIAAQKVRGIDGFAVLLDVLAGSGGDKLIPAIVWQNLHPLLERESERLVRFLDDADLSSSPGVALLLPRLVERLLDGSGAGDRAAARVVEIAAERAERRAADCLAAVARASEDLSEERRRRLRERLSPALEEWMASDAGKGLSDAARLLAARLGMEVDSDTVQQVFLSPEKSDAERLRALETLIAFEESRLPDALAEALEKSSPVFLMQALPRVGRIDDRRIADVVLGRYDDMPAELRPVAIDLLMQREPWARKLIDRVREKRLPPAALDANHLRKILESNDRIAIWTVEKVWGRVRGERNPERERVVAEMTERFREAPGDPLAGEAVFRKLCAQCHVIHGEGQEVGPDLTANGRASFEQLISNIFDPSLVVGPGYEVTTVVTTGGRNLTGLVAEESPGRIVLELAGGERESVPRNRIKYTRRSALSMMPEGIEKLFSERELADLVAFLSYDKHPSDPEARPIPGAPAGKSAETGGASGGR